MRILFSSSDILASLSPLYRSPHLGLPKTSPQQNYVIVSVEHLVPLSTVDTPGSPSRKMFKRVAFVDSENLRDNHWPGFDQVLS